jgi:hypothetical protein
MQVLRHFWTSKKYYAFQQRITQKSGDGFEVLDNWTKTQTINNNIFYFELCLKAWIN